MSSTPAGLELHYLDHIPAALRPKPLYGNIMDVSPTTKKCTIVTWPSSAHQRKHQKIRTYTFMLSELPATQASRMLQRAIETWVDEVLNAAEPLSGGGVNNGNTSRSSHRRNLSLPHSHSSNCHAQEGSRSASQLSGKQQRKLLIGPRVTFLDEEDVMAPPPLPPKDAKFAQLNSASRQSPMNSPAKFKHHHHHHQRRRSSDYDKEGHAVDIGLVWWVSDLHGKRV